MSERYLKLEVDGQELRQFEVNQAFREAALADDRALAELFRVYPYQSSGPWVTKLVVPCGFTGAGANSTQVQQIVRPETGGVNVASFRALIGSRSGSLGAILGSPSGPKEHRVDVRSGIYSPGLLAWSEEFIELPANTSGSTVWVVVYARVAIADGTEATADSNTATRYGKSAVGVTGAYSVTLYTNVTVTVLATVAFPADDPATGVYYVPLAYVRTVNGFGPTTDVTYDDIHEVSPCAQLHSSSGAVVSRPAQSSWSEALPTLATHTPWATTGARPNVYLPPTMTGAQEIWLPIQFVGTASAVDGDVVDQSVDWRNRLFQWTASFDVYPFAFQPDMTDVEYHVPNGKLSSLTNTDHVATGLGQSFHGSSSDTRTVAHLDLGGGVIELTVHGTTGAMHLRVLSGSPNQNILFLIKASGQFIPR